MKHLDSLLNDTMNQIQLQQIHDEWLKDVMSQEPNHSYDSLFNKLPKLDDLVNDPDPMAHCKFFMPGTGLSWYVIAACQVGEGNWILNTYATGPDCSEFGDVSLSDLQSAVGPYGACVERDRYFTPVPVSTIRSEEDRTN